MNIKNTRTLGMLLFWLVLASGCAATQAPWETTEMGQSVINMILNQTANPEAGLDNPSSASSGEVDGNKSAKALELYRAALPAKDAGTGEVVINIGK